MNIQGVLSTGLTFLKDLTMSNFGRTPCIRIVTTGSAGMFRLRRRIRSDFAQHDSAKPANAINGTAERREGRVPESKHPENAGCKECRFRKFSLRVTQCDFGRTPCIGIVTTGCTGMFRLRRRMRSDFAQHDSG
jgi:hypothetical protein